MGVFTTILQNIAGTSQIDQMYQGLRDFLHLLAEKWKFSAIDNYLQ